MNPILTLIESSAERFDEKFVHRSMRFDGVIDEIVYHRPAKELKAFLRAEQYAVIEAVRAEIQSRVKTSFAWGTRTTADDIRNQTLSDILLALPDKPKEV